MTSVNLDQLAGRRVLWQGGEAVGHIEEIIAEKSGNDLIVAEYHIGIFAAFERLSSSTIGTALLDFFQLRRRGRLYRIPWDKLDISDPVRPKLLCSAEELRSFTAFRT